MFYRKSYKEREITQRLSLRWV